MGVRGKVRKNCGHDPRSRWLKEEKPTNRSSRSDGDMRIHGVQARSQVGRDRVTTLRKIEKRSLCQKKGGKEDDGGAWEIFEKRIILEEKRE